MPKITERDAQFRVFTFKEGLLSAVAHDLELEVTRASVEWPDDASRIVAELDAASLRVLHPIVDGRPSPGALSARDRAKIEHNIVEDVLHAARYPSIRFEGTVSWAGGLEAGPTISGTLSLHGRSRPVEVRVERRADAWLATARLHQPDFGIQPYSAMLGTLRIQPDIRIEVRIATALAPPR